MLTNKLPLPAIAHVIIDDSLLHYVVITKVKDDTVVVFDPAKLGLSVVQTGADANGVPTFSLATIYNGQTAGTAMPLMAHWDASGEPIGLTFPASLLPNLTVTP